MDADVFPGLLDAASPHRVEISDGSTTWTIDDPQGVSILLVEQDVERALGLAARGYLLVEGRVVAEGSSAELRQSAAVRAAVLGT